MNSQGKRFLKKLVIRYCDWGGSSRGMRQFLNEKIVDFAKQHPEIEIDVVMKRNRHPFMKGIYQHEHEKMIDCPNRDVDWIEKKLKYIRDSSGGRMSKRYAKPVYSQRPTIQGLWDQDVPYQRFSFEVEDRQ